MTPVYLIRDPELFKKIAIKEFDSFEDRKFVVKPESDTLMGNAVFLMRGQHWRDMRTTLSPSFTGNKMRRMFELISECAMESTKYLVKTSENSGPVHAEMEDFYSRYTNDVIASCAFGLKINSLEDKDNEFLTTGKRLQTYLRSVQSMINILCQKMFPGLMKALDIEFLSATIRNVFTKQVLSNMDERHSKGIVRPDLIDSLMRVRAQYKRHDYDPSDASHTKNEKLWTDEELVAQCFVFFLAGFDTVTWFLVSSSYHLAIHPDIQDRLLEEVDDTTSRLNGQSITYDDIHKMNYIDMVVSEVLRVSPPATYVDRVCTKDCDLSDGDKINVKIEKGTEIWIPIYCYHHNPKYFPDPERFDPERFSEENKPNMNPAHYVPFGTGPRSCIGNRFALMEAKVILYYLLKEIKFEVAPNTVVPMKLESTPFGLRSENGLKLKLVRR